MKGVRRIPGRPFSLRGKIPKSEKSRPSEVSIILTSHIIIIIMAEGNKLRMNRLYSMFSSSGKLIH